MNDEIDAALIERVALAIEATMFAPHELPVSAELHAKYKITALAAILTKMGESISLGDVTDCLIAAHKVQDALVDFLEPWTGFTDEELQRRHDFDVMDAPWSIDADGDVVGGWGEEDVGGLRRAHLAGESHAESSSHEERG